MSSLTSPGLKSLGDKAIIKLRPYLEKLGAFTTDFSGDFLGKTKYVSVPVIAGTAETFAHTTANYAHTTGTLKFADVACTTHKKCTFSLDDVDCLEIEDAPMWEKFAQASADVVGKALVEAAMGKLTYAKRAGTITCSTVTLANVAAIAADVMGKGINPADCALLLRPAEFFTLVGLLPASAYGDGDVLKSGVIDGSLFGFKSIQAAPNASNASAADATAGIGFVVPQGALAVAARLPKPPKGGYIEIGEHVDEVTGFTFGIRVHVDPNEGETFLNVESLFGCELTKDDAGTNGAPGFYQVVNA